MNVEQFYHVCRSAAAVANVQQVFVFGSSAICPWIHEIYYLKENKPNLIWPSNEVDIDLGNEDLTTLVDGTLGEGSLFQETHHVYAHGVSLSHFTAPSDWRLRAHTFIEPLSEVKIITPHPLDLSVSKLIRGQDKDWEFAKFCHDFLDVTKEEIIWGLGEVLAVRLEYTEHVKIALDLLPFKF